MIEQNMTDWDKERIAEAERLHGPGSIEWLGHGLLSSTNRYPDFDSGKRFVVSLQKLLKEVNPHVACVSLTINGDDVSLGVRLQDGDTARLLTINNIGDDDTSYSIANDLRAAGFADERPDGDGAYIIEPRND